MPAAMEGRCDALQLCHQQAVLFARINRVDEIAAGVGPEGVEVEALADAVHAGIGSAAAMDDDRGLQDTRKACLQFALNR